MGPGIVFMQPKPTGMEYCYNKSWVISATP